MKTDELIVVLTADLDTRPAPLVRVFALDVVFGFVASATFFFIFLGLRETFFTSLDNPRFLFKFLFTSSMAASGLVLAYRLARPVADLGVARYAVWLSPAMVVAACLTEMATVPSGEWLARTIGHNALNCLIRVPLIALAPLAALFMALRHGAPANPRRAGAAAAFGASGLAATLYAMNCPDDSPFFVAVWYSLATAFVVVLGRLAGGRWLRW